MKFKVLSRGKDVILLYIVAFDRHCLVFNSITTPERNSFEWLANHEAWAAKISLPSIAVCMTS
jgi:hypothetical protein